MRPSNVSASSENSRFLINYEPILAVIALFGYAELNITQSTCIMLKFYLIFEMKKLKNFEIFSFSDRRPREYLWAVIMSAV